MCKFKDRLTLRDNVISYGVIKVVMMMMMILGLLIILCENKLCFHVYLLYTLRLSKRVAPMMQYI